jgi:hypothetical protein
MVSQGKERKQMNRSRMQTGAWGTHDSCHSKSRYQNDFEGANLPYSGLKVIYNEKFLPWSFKIFVIEKNLEM